MWKQWIALRSVRKAIHEAIDTYPGGLLFADLKGRLILVNRKMNALALEKTGHTILNADYFWQELTEHPQEDSVTVEYPSGNVWSFQKKRLQEGSHAYLQIEATDVTELYGLRHQLQENVEQVQKLHDRQKKLLQNIVQTNLDKETLSAKMRIHDQLNRCLVATQKAIQDGQLDTVLSAWEDTLRDFQNLAKGLRTPASSPETELRQVANLIGCELLLEGPQPRERDIQLLFFSAIREGLLNAVRHANASILWVRTQCLSRWYLVEISSNGDPCPQKITEGNGLSTLRKRLEEEGGSLEIGLGRSVILKIKLPKENEVC